MDNNVVQMRRPYTNQSIMRTLGNLYEFLDNTYKTNLKECNRNNYKNLQKDYIKHFPHLKKDNTALLDFYHVFILFDLYIFIDSNLTLTLIYRDRLYMNHNKIVYTCVKQIEQMDLLDYYGKDCRVNVEYEINTLKCVKKFKDILEKRIKLDLEWYKIEEDKEDHLSMKINKDLNLSYTSGKLGNKILYNFVEIEFIKLYLKSMWEVYYLKKILRNIGLFYMKTEDFLELKSTEKIKRHIISKLRL